MFVRAPNPIWYMVDHVGQPLNDEYYAFFLTNTLPYLPQNVYRDPQGQTVWTGDIVQFSPAGTLPDNLYFDPDLVYRIEIRHGNSQMDALIWEINNFVPEGSGSIINDEVITSTENLVTNPQFSFINFSSPLVITAAGTYDVAPGWQLILTGSGSTTITQEITTGLDNTGLPPGNPTPPYYLKIANTGWSSAILFQRFSGNGELFNNGALTMSATARAEVSSELFSLTYSPESPGTPQLVASTTLTTGDFQIVSGIINVVQSTNSNPNDESYVDMLITLPGTGTVDISNVQFIGQVTPLDDPTTALAIPFQEESQERQEDHLFHYYKNAVVAQPKSSFIAGWNFPFNPWHFRTTTLTNVATNTYTADQTIIIQQNYVNAATGNNVAVGRGSPTDGYTYQIKAVTATNKCMVLQYIDPAIMRAYWGKKLSSMVKAFITTTHNTQLQFKLRLMYKTGLPGTVSQTVPVSAWSNTDNSIPVVSGDGWTYITPLNDPTYTLTGTLQDFSFDGFVLPQVATTLGICLIMMNNMNQTATADIINIESISLVKNDFAIETDSETYESAVRKCQYYFEYSYDAESAIGLNTFIGAVTTQEPLLSSTAPGLQTPFKSMKRTNAAVTWYSPQTGTANTIYNQSTPGDYTVLSSTNASANTTGYPTISGDIPDGDTVTGHWVADARLGL